MRKHSGLLMGTDPKLTIYKARLLESQVFPSCMFLAFCMLILSLCILSNEVIAYVQMVSVKGKS